MLKYTLFLLALSLSTIAHAQFEPAISIANKTQPTEGLMIVCLDKDCAKMNITHTNGGALIETKEVTLESINELAQKGLTHKSYYTALQSTEPMMYEWTSDHARKIESDWKSGYEARAAINTIITPMVAIIDTAFSGLASAISESDVHQERIERRAQRKLLQAIKNGEPAAIKERYFREIVKKFFSV